MSFQPARLDVDPSILDTQLMFVQPEQDSLLSSLAPVSKVEELDSLLPLPDYPSVTVTPRPGLCVKTKNQAGQKFFLNLCRLTEVPSPAPMTEQELERMIGEEDYSCLWRVPMSLGEPRKEKDKAGTECWTAEVAVNTSWFESTMKDSQVFTGFVITVAMEGLGEKFGDTARLDRDAWVILKNKKAMGEPLPAHRIQQRSSAGIEAVEEQGEALAPSGSRKALTASGQRKTLSSSGPWKTATGGAVLPPALGSQPGQGGGETRPNFRLVAEPDIRQPSRWVVACVTGSSSKLSPCTGSFNILSLYTGSCYIVQRKLLLILVHVELLCIVLIHREPLNLCTGSSYILCTQSSSIPP